MLGRALTSVAWGMVADRYGRKPVIVIGTIAVLVLTTIFQLIYLQLSLNVFSNTSKMSPFFFFFLRVIFNTLFGLSVNFWMAIATRFLLGSLNGLLGPIKVQFRYCIFVSLSKKVLETRKFIVFSNFFPIYVCISVYSMYIH